MLSRTHTQHQSGPTAKINPAHMPQMLLLLCTCCSRNLNLTVQGRQQAASLYAALCWAKEAVQQQHTTDAAVILQEVTSQITAAGGKVDYVEARHAHHLEPVSGNVTLQPTVILVAAWFEGKAGSTVRLIDNVVL